MEKHVIYAEDLLWEIMQHPSKSISKSLIRECTDKVIAEKELTMWQAVKGTLTRRVKK